ncbi:TolC family protein [Dyella silvae]|uniref:TolC family protein n=1 Tax=Dyella silvae TaxID=2994424 RepID=UPI002264CCF0|nr:TolC family protein [Dyella silvae]
MVPRLTGLSRLGLACVACLTGCVMVGPDFHPQHEEWVEHWDDPVFEKAISQQSQPDFSQWWHVFGDQNLERLMTEADAHNANLKIAGLRVLEARAQLGIAQSGRYPQVQQIGGDALYTKSKHSGGGGANSSGSWQYGVGFDIGWELDFWGRFRRAIEAANASYFASQANHDAVLVLLHAQVADTYFTMRTAEARLKIARENAALQKRSLEITDALFKSGQTDELDLQQAKTQYLSTLSTIPNFESQITLAQHALSTLIGRPPGPLPELNEQPGKEGVIPLVDRAVLQDVPANLLLRRPDVRAAELYMASQSALIGVAKADLYPTVTLLGTLAWSASSSSGTPSSILSASEVAGSPSKLALAVGPSVTWNVFDHGRIVNNVRVQDARLQQLTVAYQDTVRQAAREADDAATGLIAALQRDSALFDAEKAASRSLSLANTVYREGYSDFERVLDAQRALAAQQDAYVVNRSNAVGSLIALYKAVGGGWHTEQPMIDPATREQMEQRTNWGDLIKEESNAPSTTVPTPAGQSR